jgi:hypothetical protein
MRRYRAAAHLPKRSAFVEVVEDFLHWCAGDAGRPILMVRAEYMENLPNVTFMLFNTNHFAVIAGFATLGSG